MRRISACNCIHSMHRMCGPMLYFLSASHKSIEDQIVKLIRACVRHVGYRFSSDLSSQVTNTRQVTRATQ